MRVLDPCESAPTFAHLRDTSGGFARRALLPPAVCACAQTGSREFRTQRVYSVIHEVKRGSAKPAGLIRLVGFLSHCTRSDR